MTNKLKVFNRLATIIKDFEAKNKLIFKPSKEFYKTVGIPQKRFGQILRNQVSMTLDEVHSLSQYFGLNEIISPFVMPAKKQEPTEANKKEEVIVAKKDWISKAEAMKFLKIKSQTTINELIFRGELEQKKIGRSPYISKASLETYFNKSVKGGGK